jgi:glycosyltransferase involved in cell wall biosynthesis
VRIAIVSIIPIFPCIGGNRARLLSLVDGLAALGHALDFIHLPSRQVRDFDVAAHQARFGADHVHILDRGALDDLRYYTRRALAKARRTVGRALRLDGAQYYDLDEQYFDGFTRQLRRLDARRRYDAVIVEYVANSKAFGAFPDALGILDVHDAFTDRHLVAPGYSLRAGDERRGFLRSDIVLSIQDEESARFRRQLGQGVGRVETVSHSMDVSHRAPRTDALAATFIGSAFEANIESLHYFVARVLPELLRREPAFRLVVAGTICNSIADHPAITKLGLVPHLSDAFAAASVSVNPIRRGTGINIKLLDSMAAGIPSVSTETGLRGLPARYRGGVVGVADDDATGFAEQVLHLLRDRDAWQRASDAAYDAARRWNEAQRDALAAILPGADARDGTA